MEERWKGRTDLVGGRIVICRQADASSILYGGQILASSLVGYCGVAPILRHLHFFCFSVSEARAH